MKKNTINPNNTPKENISLVRKSKKIFFTNTGPRDTGQSDYKNRHTLYDLIKLAPIYNKTGYFSVENHGGARFHQNLLHNKINPFDEIKRWRASMPDTLTQTLIRATNLWGYRMYPANIIKFSVRAFLPYVDIWRCFDFLNYIPNMIPIATEVLGGEKIFEPAIAFSNSEDCTDKYYLRLIKEIVNIAGGTDQIILCIKDMAGVGSPKRISVLINKILERHPDLIIQYHRHSTDGLAILAYIEAAKAGVKILDVTDDAFSRFYGQPPIKPIVAMLKEYGIEANVDHHMLDIANEIIMGFIRSYSEFESQFRGFSYNIIQHKMPGGAIPSSFEQALKGGFIELMPWIFKGMSYGNKIIKYFDVTPGSQITWATWAGIIQFFYKEGGIREVEELLSVCKRFVDNKQDIYKLDKREQTILKGIYSRAMDDLKGLLLGRYGPLPFGWPNDWVYESVFGSNWKKRVKEERSEDSPLLNKPDEDVEKARQDMETILGRSISDEELVIYLQHPQAAIDYFRFREKYGDTSVLPTDVWLNGLRNVGDEVRFRLSGKPNTIKLVSVGKEVDGFKHLVISVNNIMHVFPVEMPSHKLKEKIRFADPKNQNEIGAPVRGNVWRIGNKDRKLLVGDILKKGQEIINIEAMKIENSVISPKNAVVKEILIRLNEAVVENQLLMILEDPKPGVEDKGKLGKLVCE